MLQKIGKYQIIERVGAGAMGEVFKSFDPMLRRWVALKVFSRNVEVTKELRARFFQEAQAGAMLSHPNIVTVHDLGEQDGHLFIVMELLEGEELRQLIASRKNIGLEEKLSLMVQVCKGVEYAHNKGVIHRDIKPGNIFVLTNGHVKLLDFGVARFAAIDTGLTRAGLIMGTLRYMSPEQCRGRADHRSDIFSVGAVFYELLTYRQAFTADDTFGLIEQVQNVEPPPLKELDPGLPEPLSASIHRALRKNPSDRFANIADMRMELEQIHRRLLDEADGARTRVRVGLDEVQSLKQALAASAGAVPALERLSGIGSLPSGVSEPAEELKRDAQAGLEEEVGGADQSDMTLVDTPIPNETLRLLPSSTINANVEAYETRQLDPWPEIDDSERPVRGLANEALEPDSSYPVLARRRRSRRGWLTAGALAGVTLIGVTYFLLVGKESLRPWLPDLGAGMPTPAQVSSDHPDAVERGAEPAASVGRNHEVASARTLAAEVPPPPVPERTDTPIELPPRSGGDQADRVPPPPSRRAKEPPGAALSPERAMIGKVTPTPSAPAPHSPSPTPPPPSTRPILPALSANATLNETVAWLTQALTEHAKIGRLPSGVMYGVRRLDGCRIDWGAYNSTAQGYEVRAALNNLDPDRTRATERGGGWAIDLPWKDEDNEADKERQTVGTERFTGLMVWFPEADTAKNAVSAFKRAITLCSR